MDWMKAMAEVPQKELRPIYILRGNEPSLTARIIEQIRRRVEQVSNQETGIQRFWFDDDGTAKSIRACQTIGLFGTGDVVVLEQCLLFGSSTKIKGDPTELEGYFSAPVEGRVLVITVPDDAWDERRKLAKQAKTHALIDCSTPKPDARSDILKRIANEKEINIVGPAVAELLRRTDKITTAERELEKLTLFVSGGTIVQEDVAHVIPLPVEDNVFAWVGAVMEGKADVAFASAEAILRSGHDPVGMLALIARQVRLMWYANWGASRNVSQAAIASRVGAHPYALKVAGGQATGVSLPYLEGLLTMVADAEYAVKSGRRDAAQALDWVMMSCLAIKHERRRVR